MRYFSFWIGIILVLTILWDKLLFIPHDDREILFVEKKSVTLLISGQTLFFRDVIEESVGSFLLARGYDVQVGEQIFPERSAKLLPGTIIILEPVRTIGLVVDGRNEKITTSLPTAELILQEMGVTLDEDDLVVPSRRATVSGGSIITVTRVLVQEEVKDTDIAYTTKTLQDGDLSWRKKEVRQKGKKGVKRTIFRVSYHNGKEISRKVLRTEIIESPTEEIVVQGTLVKVGKTHKGAASWYAWTGTLAAANPWLPKGSYVRVTNLDNGKSVIVVINDRGPFVPGRILDLDKVAFEKIASIGAGVINIKMEEIIN